MRARTDDSGFDGRRFGAAAGATVALGADDPLLFGSRLAGQYASMRAAHDLTDAQVADLEQAFGPAGVVELTTMIAVENQRARANHALGITDQGFDAACRIRWETPPTAQATPPVE